MSLTFQSLTSRQTSLIQNLRIDVYNFAGGPGDLELDTNLKTGTLTALPGLRKLQLCSNAYEGPDSPTTIAYRSFCSVDSVREPLAPRPTSAVVSLEHGYVYNTLEVRLLAQSFAIQESLNRLQEILVDAVSVGMQRL